MFFPYISSLIRTPCLPYKYKYNNKYTHTQQDICKQTTLPRTQKNYKYSYIFCIYLYEGRERTAHVTELSTIHEAVCFDKYLQAARLA